MHCDMKKWFVYSICLIVVSAQGNIETYIDEFIEEVISCADIPGFGLTVIRDGEDFISKGYGVKNLETQEPVTNETLFVINSCTKAFTGVSLAIVLKNNSEVDLMTPVRDILGEDFYLNDTIRTQHVSISDALAHRTGLAYNDELRIAGYSLDEFVERLQYLEYPSYFRNDFNYNNVMYGIPMLVAETLDGRNWTQIVREEIYGPLSMDSSGFIVERDLWPSIVQPYRPDSNGDLRAVDLEVAYAYYNTVPAIGGIATTPLDMRKWLKFQLNEGVDEDGTEVLTPEEFAETIKSRNHIDGSTYLRRPTYPVTYAPNAKYALGWELTAYRDYLMRQHTGSQASFNSRVTLLPEMGHAIFMTMNKTPVGNVRDLVASFIFDLLLGEEPWLNKDNVCDFISDTASSDDQHISMGNMVPNKQCNSKGCQEFTVDDDKSTYAEEFIGIYGHYAYGNITIENDTETGNLIMLFGRDSWTWDLSQVTENEFLGQGREPLWYHTVTLNFDRDDENVPVSVIVSFDSEIPPRFDRDLDWVNLPPPPQICE